MSFQIALYLKLLGSLSLQMDNNDSFVLNSFPGILSTLCCRLFGHIWHLRFYCHNCGYIIHWSQLWYWPPGRTFENNPSSFSTDLSFSYLNSLPLQKSLEQNLGIKIVSRVSVALLVIHTGYFNDFELSGRALLLQSVSCPTATASEQ